MKFIDTHAHLDFPRFDKDREEIIENCFAEGIEKIVNIGADLNSSRNSVELARKNENIYAAVGLHPHDADQFNSDLLADLKELAKFNKVVAIGEAGLDFYYDNSPRQLQKIVFRAQIRLAHSLDLPLVIHSREAAKETLEILQEEEVPAKGAIMHCYAYGPEFAEEILQMNIYFAFGGLVTFPNTVPIQDTAKLLPLDKILIETDAPYLTPVPYRGKRNEPLYVKYVAKKIASLKNLSLEEVAESTTKNAKKIYNFN